MKRRFLAIVVSVAAAALGAWLSPAAASSGSSSPIPGNELEVNVTQTSSPISAAGEPEIAVNPRDPNNLVYVATQEAQADDPGRGSCYLFYSTNGGATWVKVPWPLGANTTCGDPMVAVNSAGTFFVASDLFATPVPVPVNEGGASAVGVARSTDGGRTWSQPVATGTMVDRPFFRVDAATGKLYEQSGLGSRLLVVSADDGQTWSEGVPFRGSHVAVFKGVVGTAVQQRSSTPNAPTQLMFDVSTDDGQTFTTHPVMTTQGTPVMGGTGDWVSADPTSRGRFAVMQRIGNDLQVFVTADSGNIWTGPTIVNAANAVSGHVWMDFGPTGALGLMWKTTEVNVFSSISFDHGKTFSPPVRVNSQTATAPRLNPLGDDLSWITLGRKYAYIGWADTRTGVPNGFFARVPLSAYR